ncbi:MAG TPA: hypothetical protein VII38_10265 [Polyangia bacterium]|jgi:hypothetical protein
MKPFRTSLTARCLAAATAIALVGAGLLPILGIPVMYVSVPILVSVVIAVFGMLLGVNDHPGTIGLLACTLPVAMWAYVLAALGVLKVYPAWSWALVAAGLVPIALSVGFALRMRARVDGSEREQIVEKVAHA